MERMAATPQTEYTIYVFTAQTIIAIVLLTDY